MNIVILGASGNIGKQSLEVIFKFKENFSLIGFSVGNNTRAVSNIVKKFNCVKYICIKNPAKIPYFQKKYPNIEFYSGDEGLIYLIDHKEVEMVENALVGFVGFVPTLRALQLNKKVALANKESLVVGGELIKKELRKGNGTLYPIDSEHVAISKCLKVDNHNVDSLILTASGGAFRNLKREDLHNVTKDDALKHPNWKMGNKITIDCDTMINKCFEVIEAHYLFDYPFESIKILMHDESYIHSMVNYKSGIYRAEISRPDMKKCIEYALFEGNIPFKTYLSKDYHNFGNYHFRELDSNRYPLTKYAERVIKEKGNLGAILNASSEIAVNAFLNDQISFLDIEKIVEHCINNVKYIANVSIDSLIKTDILTRRIALKIVEKGVK